MTLSCLVKVSIIISCLNHVTESQFLTPVVEVEQGKLRGVLGRSGDSHYFSVPYATATRFQYPQPPSKWKGTLNAIRRFIRCPQNFGFIIGREDCLYLDIHIPKYSKGSKFAVFIFFHGGAYWHGGKDLYHPLVLNEKSVIVVSINYRLGVLGFLCTNNVSNIGLRDQVAAMKWIQKNIGAFGGDPDNVTICGQSAGASLASMHLLSKSSRGLFHKLILMSGNAFSTWAFNVESHRTTLLDANKIARANTESEIYKVLSEANLEILMRATTVSSVDLRHFRYSPCIDTNNSDPFFTDTPYNSITSGKFNEVPILTGYTDLEGMFFSSILRKEDIKDISENLFNHLPVLFSWCTKKVKKKIANAMRSYYFGNYSSYYENVDGIIQLYSDWIANGASNAFSNLLTKFSNHPVFNYLFSYYGGQNYGKELSGVNLNTSTHSDDVFYIFKPMGISLISSQRDRNFTEKMNTMFANFIKYGNPTPSITSLLPILWPPATNASSNIMVLDEQLSVLQQPRRDHRGEFFLNMLCTYGRKGYVPCESTKMCDNED